MPLAEGISTIPRFDARVRRLGTLLVAAVLVLVAGADARGASAPASGVATSAGVSAAANAPTIRSFVPKAGPAGSSVAIDGSDFTGATSVTFNDVSAQFTVTYDLHIETAVPAGATTGPIRVTTPAGTATSATAFTVTDPPVTTGFAPASGPVGTPVTINGKNFALTTSVLFRFVQASFTVISDTEVQAIVPPATNTGPLSVFTEAGRAQTSTSFIVEGAPSITGFTPASGAPGASVTISGQSFTGATGVTFGNVGAPFVVTSDAEIQTTVPAAAARGPAVLHVDTPAGRADSPALFRVILAPLIQSLTPFGQVGAEVNISGADFDRATAVTFNGVSASFTVISSDRIQTTVPEGATSGPLAITTPVGTGTSPTGFKVAVVLSVAKTGAGQGFVVAALNPQLLNRIPISCGGTCAAFYELGAAVTLTATPSATSNFAGWDGCDTTSGATCTVTANKSRLITAVFDLKTFPLTVQKTSTLGIGNGTVTSASDPPSPDQIDCGATCSVRFAYGTVVTLTVRPDLLAVFNGWSGCDAPSGTSCSVTVTGERAVTASFLP